MTNNVLLDNVTHKNLKVITERGASLGDNVRCAIVIPREFRQVASCYPIVFRKNPSNGQFESVALFGFNETENVFLDESGWDADYIPLSIQRLPFVIGYTRDHSTGKTQPVIHIDMDHPRVSFEKGELVFLEHGGKTPFLERINSVLAELINGIEENKLFTAGLVANDLLEPFTLKVQLDNGTNIEAKGFYTINEEKLRSLTEGQLKQLHEHNFLEMIYLTIASFSNVRKMVKRMQNNR